MHKWYNIYGYKFLCNLIISFLVAGDRFICAASAGCYKFLVIINMSRPYGNILFQTDLSCCTIYSVTILTPQFLHYGDTQIA